MPKLYRSGLSACCIVTWLEHRCLQERGFIRCRKCGLRLVKRPDGDWESREYQKWRTGYLAQELVKNTGFGTRVTRRT